MIPPTNASAEGTTATEALTIRGADTLEVNDAAPKPTPPTSSLPVDVVPTPNASAISFFERYLTVWVGLCMAGGALIGFYAPSVADALSSAQVEGVNVIIAVLLWVMLFPMFLTLDFREALHGVRAAPAALLITTGLNYCVKPFTMWGLGLFFTRVVFVTAMPEAELRDSYVAGLVLLAGAPCTAMVFVWSSLLGGSPGYTLAQVALNDGLMLLLYVPICGALIGATGLALPWATIAACVGFFIVAPLALASLVRALVLGSHGEAFLNTQVVARIKPLTTLALLLTLVLIFVFQGATLGSKAAAIFMLAVPISIQCVLLWAIAYALCWQACIPHERTAPASLIATSNFFELAVAVAVALYGPASGAALATVVGVLVEVPIMLAFVQLCLHLKPALDRRCSAWGGHGTSGSGGALADGCK
jgi:ACR3 family arsenite transporter